MTRPTRPLKLQQCYKAVFSSNSESLFTLSRDVVGWNVGRRSKRFRVHPFSHPACCTVHPDDTTIVVKNTSGQLVLLDGNDGTILRMLDNAANNEGSNVLHTASGEHIVDGSWDGQLTVRSAKTGVVEFRKDFPGEMITHIARTSRGDKWFVVHQPKAVINDKPPGAAYISVWNWPIASPIDHLIAPEDSIKSISIAPDDTRLCVQGNDLLAVIRLEDKQPVSSTAYVYGGTQFVVAWAPNGEEIAAVQKDSVVFYAPDTMEQLDVITLQYACDVAYAPNGKPLALGSWKSGLLIERTNA